MITNRQNKHSANNYTDNLTDNSYSHHKNFKKDKLYPIKDWTDMHNINEMAPASKENLS